MTFLVLHLAYAALVILLAWCASGFMPARGPR